MQASTDMTSQPLAAPAARSGSASVRRGRSRLANLAIMAVTAAVILVVAYTVNRPSTAPGSLQRVDLIGTPQGPPPIVGQIAPPLRATALDGSTVDVAALVGKPVWISFGATWCQPCRAENPDIQAAYEAYQAQGLVVVQIYMNEDASVAAEYAARVGLTYVKVPDPDGRLSIDYRILGIPSHFFVDRSGVLQQIKVGTLDRAGIDAIMAELM